MLKGIDPLLHPDLLHALASMGHGDEIVIADANFPAAAVARRLIRLDGIDAPEALRAVLTVLPLDEFVDSPAAVMTVVGNPRRVPEAVRAFQPILDGVMGRPVAIERLDRFAFYERARSAFAVLATGDTRKYANIILAKGVIARD
jgi:L-fucose mutarotase